MKSAFASGVVMSLSNVPDRRSRSVVIEVMRNITMKGKSARIAPPNWSKTPG